MPPATNVRYHIQHAFRQDANKILAILIKLYGPTNIMWAEDTLQDTFTKAMQHWQANGIPANPTAWLILAAKRSAIDKLRNINLRKIHLKSQILVPELDNEDANEAIIENHFQKNDFVDEELRLLFWIAATDMPVKLQLPLMLKTLCGLSLEAICDALLERRETIKKRLQRARKKIAEQAFELPCETVVSHALDKVHLALYLLFNEGVSPRNLNTDKRMDLCIDALGLTRLLIDSKTLRNQETLALSSLMHFHYARLSARKTGDFLSVPLDEQARENWDKQYLVKAVQLLSIALASPSEDHPRYLLEALILHEHCRAKTFLLTDWRTILQHYDALLSITGSPIVKLNRAVALAHTGDVNGAISEVEAIKPNKQVAGGYRASATLAYLYVLKGDTVNAKIQHERSVQSGLTEPEAVTLARRIEAIETATK